jgi:uncharacterized protein (DUF2252 family)
VDVLTSQNVDRVDSLVPIRHSRMSESPFAFYRGAAKIMARDLASTPVTGLRVQLCGDAHLANFGSYASPDRRQVFDLNDFDETLPGPWEWDVKRLATSFVVAGRDNGFDAGEIESVTVKSVAAYREAMAGFADAGTMDLWYSQLSVDQILSGLPRKKDRKRVAKQAKKARSKDSLRAFSKLVERVDGAYLLKSDAPLLVPLRELPIAAQPDDIEAAVESSFASYMTTLNDDRKRLLERFRIVDVAIKVVGVGSVGTRCMIVLLVGRDESDPLFLQVKQASRSVLEDYLPNTQYPEHGQRVVEGQRLMQATSDIFLGWATEAEMDHHYYWRQLHDMKGSANVEAMDPTAMGSYAKLCAWTLARAHARSGDSIAMSGYMGSGDAFDRAVMELAVRCADQNENDYAAFVRAIEAGRIESRDG